MSARWTKRYKGLTPKQRMEKIYAEIRAGKKKCHHPKRKKEVVGMSGLMDRCEICKKLIPRRGF